MSHTNGNGAKARALRQSILTNPLNARSEIIPIKTMGLALGFRGLKAWQAVEFRAAAKNEDGTIDEGKVHAAGIIASVFEPETGDLVFSEADRDTVLHELGWGVFQELAAEVTRVSGLPSKETDDATEKNSQTPAATSDTPSASPSASE